MSTPLDLAVDIAGTVARVRGTRVPLDVAATSADMSRRYSDTGFSRREIAEALVEEGSSAGLPVVRLG